MKQLKVVLTLLVLIAISSISALKFDPDYFHSRSIVSCFTMEAVGNIEGILDFKTEDGIVKTGLASFDILAQEFEIVGLEQMHPTVKMPEWNDNGMYLQNIYRIKLASDDRIDDAVATLAKNEYLHYAELETINRSYFVPNDPMISQQYALDLIRAFEAWDYIMGSHEVVIAITDSGVKWNHPDLRGNIWINAAEAHNMSLDWENGLVLGGDGINNNGGSFGKVDDLIGWDFFNNDNNPMQNWTNNDHGTHVAGCAGAVGNNGIGVAGPSPIVSIMSCKGASNTSNSTGISYGYNQMQYAAEMGAHIINASWGGPGSGTYPNQIVNYCTNMGALVVTAAGNSNLEHGVGGYNDYPADATNALCVAATNSGDYKSSFSDYGAPIDISAPGEGIMSTIIAGNGYAAYDGTSMASPIVAGVAALVKAMHPGMPPLDLKQRLEMTADYIYDKNPNYVGKLGSGRVNAFAATMYDKIPYIVIDDMLLEEIEGDGDTVANPGEIVRLKLQLYNYLDPFTGLSWANATGVTATIRCHYPGVTIIDSVASYGNLFAGSSMWNNSSPFSFQTISALPSEPLPFELVIASNQQDDYPYNKVIPFTVELSLAQQGWPVNLGGASQSSPILVDANGDGNVETVFADHTGNVHMVRTDGVSQLPGFPLNLGANIVGSLAMANLNGDAYREFVACLSNNTISAFNKNGEILWNVPAGGTLRSGPIVAALTLSGSPQIIVSTQNRYLVVLNADGQAYPNFPILLDGAMLAPPAVADLNLDGNLEILAATIGGSLHAIKASDASNMPGFPVTMPGGSQNPITIANLDADQNPEILVGTSSSGHFLAYNHDGSVFFEKNVSGQIRSGAVIADVNNDGSKEIILVTFDGTVYIMNANGTDLSGFPMSIGQSVEGTPVVARFDGDNYAGIIFGDTAGMLHSIRADGNQSPNFPIHLSGNLKVSPALGDIDRDGDMEIVVPNDSSFNVIDIKRPAQAYLWYCFLGSYNRSGNSYQTTPNQENTIPVVQTTLGNNYPNPFNPITTISYSVKDNAPVTLEVYNLKGQLVKTLVNEIQPSGNHQVTWNGTDNSGSAVGSGVYYYRLRSGRFSSTKKMVLMK